MCHLAAPILRESRIYRSTYLKPNRGSLSPPFSPSLYPSLPILLILHRQVGCSEPQLPVCKMEITTYLTNLSGSYNKTMYIKHSCRV